MFTVVFGGTDLVGEMAWLKGTCTFIVIQIIVVSGTVTAVCCVMVIVVEGFGREVRCTLFGMICQLSSSSSYSLSSSTHY